MNTLNHLGNNIAKFRKSSDITQEQLAEQLSVSVSAVSQWETGKTMPDISAIPVLCHIFNVTADALLGIDREKEEAEIKRINAEAFLQHEEGKKHTSLFLRGSEYGTFRTSDENNVTAILLEELKSDCFDFVREEERFKALTERLKKTAGLWK